MQGSRSRGAGRGGAGSFADFLKRHKISPDNDGGGGRGGGRGGAAAGRAAGRGVAAGQFDDAEEDRPEGAEAAMSFRGGRARGGYDRGGGGRDVFAEFEDEEAYPFAERLEGLVEDTANAKVAHPMDILEPLTRGDSVEATVAALLRKGHDTENVRQLAIENCGAGFWDSLALVGRARLNELVVERSMDGASADDIDAEVEQRYGAVLWLLSEGRSRRPELYRGRDAPLDMLPCVKAAASAVASADAEQWEASHTKLTFLAHFLDTTDGDAAAGAPDEGAGSGGDEEDEGADGEAASHADPLLEAPGHRAYASVSPEALYEWSLRLSDLLQEPNAFYLLMGVFATDALCAGRGPELQSAHGFDAELWAKVLEVQAQGAHWVPEHVHALQHVIARGGTGQHVSSLRRILSHQSLGEDDMTAEAIAEQLAEAPARVSVGLQEAQEALRSIVGQSLRSISGDPEEPQALLEAKWGRVALDEALAERTENFGEAPLLRVAYGFRADAIFETGFGDLLTKSTPGIGDLDDEGGLPDDSVLPNREYVHAQSVADGLARAIGLASVKGPGRPNTMLSVPRDRPLREVLMQSSLEAHLPEPLVRSTSLGDFGVKQVEHAWQALMANGRLEMKDKVDIITFYDRYLYKSAKRADDGFRAPKKDQTILEQQEEEAEIDVEVDDDDDAMFEEWDEDEEG